ncbi:6,7-dimethyl-8-ribityllumazine synthase [Buchnera aphidicola (Schlechtendalia chinensis)]|uniref:6,7-dimethyl-8-ribityllumazine synthase n=1 Tax=Buchnera aphidicola subsp. Schlechtendalia chinensis TaxID=118110 RepID=A0A172WE03_BUCSC|nr:6,7-dimethyl-8-ribityllumazine synthase [Buchnera aphidicola]ANF17172.1 6,7-dimethyl-8-ribityllumazine synthase [Buchnera aphidicola (Schlechtendalia chinensis)]
MKIIKNTVLAQTEKIAIIISRFNYFINQNLLSGSLDTLKRIGQVKSENITIIHVPGTFEIPIIADIIASQKKYDAIIVLGTIIKGKTPHFSLLSNEISKKISSISIQYKIPISFGIIVANNIQQAIERSGTKMGNKGSESALVTLEMINIINKINND